MTPSLRKNIGWALAILSLIGLVLGLSFTCLALALQAMDPRGFDNNLLGFAVIVGVCPLPLALVSGVCLPVGLGLVFFAHREERESAPTGES